jgi:hypothetical protein
MSSLSDRIKFGGWQQTTAIYRPNAIDPRLGDLDVSAWRTNRPQVADYGAPTETPLVRIGIHDGLVSYESQQPLSDPQGLSVPEDSPGRWAQLYRAGRLY